MAFFITLAALAAATSTYLVHQFLTRSLSDDAMADNAAEEPREHLRAA
jgi:hypothetical protein